MFNKGIVVLRLFGGLIHLLSSLLVIGIHLLVLSSLLVIFSSVSYFQKYMKTLSELFYPQLVNIHYRPVCFLSFIFDTISISLTKLMIEYFS